MPTLLIEFDGTVRNRNAFVVVRPDGRRKRRSGSPLGYARFACRFGPVVVRQFGTLAEGRPVIREWEFEHKPMDRDSRIARFLAAVDAARPGPGCPLSAEVVQAASMQARELAARIPDDQIDLLWTWAAGTAVCRPFGATEAARSEEARRESMRARRIDGRRNFDAILNREPGHYLRLAAAKEQAVKVESARRYRRFLEDRESRGDLTAVEAAKLADYRSFDLR